jgi:hypothetical protein
MVVPPTRQNRSSAVCVLRSRQLHHHGVQAIRGVHPFAEASDAEYAFALKLSPVGALLIGVYSYWTMKDPEPPEKRLSRREWRNYAERRAIPVAIGVGWVILLLLVLLLWGGVFLLGNLSQLPPPLALAVGILVLGFMVLGFLSLAFLPPQAYEACRDQELKILEAEAPPELRIAMNLTAQIRLEIRSQQEQLSLLQQEYARQIELSKLTPEQAAAVAEILSRQQEECARRALWSNVALGFFFYLAGVVTPALVSSDALGEQLRRSLHLG